MAKAKCSECNGAKKGEPPMETISLKELVKSQPFNNYTDLEIIYNWFVENNKESEGLTIIPMLAKQQLQKINTKLSYISANILYATTTRDLFVQKENADKLDFIVKLSILDLDLKNYTTIYEWAATEIPKIKMPKPFFVPTAEYLARYNIKFKEK